MRVDPRHLRIVLAIGEHGTFNRAAAALGISQPALSKSVAQLEAALGARLFDRGKSGTSLTEAGRIVARGAHNVDRTIARAREEIAASAQRVAGPLSIGATPSMMLGILPHALGTLSQEQPRAAIRITEGLDGVLGPALRCGDIELLVGPLEPAGAPDLELEETPLARERFFVGVPHGHRLAGRTELAMHELTDEAWILPTSGSSFHRVIDALFVAAGARLPDNAIVTNSLPLQELLVAASGRLCMLTPAQIVGRSVAFAVVPLLNAPARMIGVRHLAGIGLSPLAAALLPHLRSAACTLAGSVVLAT